MIREFMERFATGEARRAHMESVRWPDGRVCPRCGSVGNAAKVRSLQLSCLQGAVHVTVGTAIEGSHLPLRVWYIAMSQMLSTAKPISARSLSKHPGIQYRTCWHLPHCLRAMRAAG